MDLVYIYIIPLIIIIIIITIFATCYFWGFILLFFLLWLACFTGAFMEKLERRDETRRGFVDIYRTAMLLFTLTFFKHKNSFFSLLEVLKSSLIKQNSHSFIGITYYNKRWK